MLATLLLPVLVLPALINAVPLQPRSPLLDAASVDVGAQYTSIGSNDGPARIARGMFDNFQTPPNGFAPSTNNDAPTPGDARPASDAPDVEEAKPISLSSIATTSATQGESRPSATTLSAVGVPRPSSDQPKVAEQNGFRYADW